MSGTVQSGPGGVRHPAVAGFFYPGDAKTLSGSVRQYLADADAKIPAKAGRVPKAIIVPHAGYIYSGLTAAAAYRTLAPARSTITRVVLMGPCHRVAVHGIALPSATAFHTPLGDVAIDQDAVAAIRSLPAVEISDATHKDDHALEVHLPFLQVVLGEGFKIVPMIVGGAAPDDVARVLDTLWGGAETLILISSDLSHYLPYDAARTSDDATRRAIENLDLLALGDNQACGRHSIKGLLQLAQAKGLTVSTADLRNSGDTAGPKDRVVGYGSWLFHEPETKAPIVKKRPVVTIIHPPKAAPRPKQAEPVNETRALLDRHGTFLLKHAAHAILAKLKVPGLPGETIPNAPELRAPGATFVTLQKDCKLRGCIGSVAPHRPLLDDVAENAVRAGFQDPRFPHLILNEIKKNRVEIHISVLSPQSPMSFTSEADLVAQIRPHRDGLILADQGRRGVFLPSVWETLPDAQTFFTHLKRKAGLPETHWSDTVQVWRYVTEEVRSENLPADVALWTVPS